MSNNEVDIHMSDLDEETKRILVESDDSKEFPPKKEEKKKYKDDDYNKYEVNDRDPLEDKEMDDKDW